MTEFLQWTGWLFLGIIATTSAYFALRSWSNTKFTKLKHKALVNAGDEIFAFATYTLRDCEEGRWFLQTISTEMREGRPLKYADLERAHKQLENLRGKK